MFFCHNDFYSLALWPFGVRAHPFDDIDNYRLLLVPIRLFYRAPPASGAFIFSGLPRTNHVRIFLLPIEIMIAHRHLPALRKRSPPSRVFFLIEQKPSLTSRSFFTPDPSATFLDPRINFPCLVSPLIYLCFFASCKSWSSLPQCSFPELIVISPLRR